mgnify:CR=1 FL=1
MKAMVERIFQWFGGVVAVLARRTATASVNSTCFYGLSAGCTGEYLVEVV